MLTDNSGKSKETNKVVDCSGKSIKGRERGKERERDSVYLYIT